MAEVKLVNATADSLELIIETNETDVVSYTVQCGNKSITHAKNKSFLFNGLKENQSYSITAIIFTLKMQHIYSKPITFSTTNNI